MAHASVTVDAKHTKEWRFYLQPLADEHYVSVSRGTPDDVVDKVGSFRATFKDRLRENMLRITGSGVSCTGLRGDWA